MDFQWFEHVTWDSIEDLRGTTYVQLPTRFRFALQQAQHAILRVIIHNNTTSMASESAWKALVLSSWLLLGRPAVNASESNCAHFLDALSGPWYVMLLRCRTRHAERTSSRCSHVFAKSLHWRVLLKKDEPWQLPETHHQFQSQNKLFQYRANRCGSCSCLLQVVHGHHGAQNALRFCLHQNQRQQRGGSGLSSVSVWIFSSC